MRLMKNVIQNGFLTLEYLSDIELYYSTNISSDHIELMEDDYDHCVKVMRNKQSDEIFITDGLGKIFKVVIRKIEKRKVISEIIKTYEYQNKFNNYTFCLAQLKNKERFKFALEKCVELGINSFIIFQSERTIVREFKPERWEKILIESMKQSLQSFKPELKYIRNLKEIVSLQGNKIAFDQKSENTLSASHLNTSGNNYYCFGPEGGFTEDELSLFDETYKLADNRLRSETAIIKCASILTKI